jgi:transcriptional regulator NrdR family protein
MPRKTRGFGCANCGGSDMLVTQTRSVGARCLKRRRECLLCGMRVTTYERAGKPLVNDLKTQKAY